MATETKTIQSKARITTVDRTVSAKARITTVDRIITAKARVYNGDTIITDAKKRFTAGKLMSYNRSGVKGVDAGVVKEAGLDTSAVSRKKVALRAISSSRIENFISCFQSDRSTVNTGFTFSGTWSNLELPNFYNGIAKKTTTSTDYVEYTFTAKEDTTIGIIATTDLDGGRINVYIDNELQEGCVDLYSSWTINWKSAVKTYNVTEGEHTIKCILRSDTSGSSTQFILNGFVVGGLLGSYDMLIGIQSIKLTTALDTMGYADVSIVNSYLIPGYDLLAIVGVKIQSPDVQQSAYSSGTTAVIQSDYSAADPLWVNVDDTRGFVTSMWCYVTGASSTNEWCYIVSIDATSSPQKIQLGGVNYNRKSADVLHMYTNVKLKHMNTGYSVELYDGPVNVSITYRVYLLITKRKTV